MRLAKHVRPAYIRLAGPSTEFVKYVDEENFSLIDSNSVIVTPSMWFGINEWLSLTQLMPIFGINDAETVKDVWNPKSVLSLFEISDKLNVTCFWQLGFGKFRSFFLLCLVHRSYAPLRGPFNCPFCFTKFFGHNIVETLY